MTADAVRLAVDIGGTFTDIALEHGRERFTRKLLTTMAAPEKAMLDGIRGILQEANVAPGQIDVVVHGTTLATNALIERKGARTALVTTEGFRDVLGMGYEKRYEHYDLDLELPEPLVPRNLRFTVPERMSTTGTVLRPLDEAAVARLPEIFDEHAIDSIAICFLHSYANPDHEERVAELLGRRLPRLSITCSSAVCPERREYERFSTAAANAYIQPLMAGYLGRLEAEMRRAGIRAACYLMTSGGGLTTIDTAMRFPIRLVESGPAGGAILAAGIAREARLDHVLSFDMGGTTAKICFIEKGRPTQSRRFEVARVWRNLKGSGLPIRVPVTEMVEIGAGGGSIADIDALGRIRVGPHSAGSMPGPACYGAGGTKPTVTDANVVLAYIDPATFAGGSLRLDVPLAHAAIDQDVASRKALSTEWAAAGILEIVDDNMAASARVHAIELGQEPHLCTMIAFGGAAPLHAARIAERLGIDSILVPRDASVGSAVGFLRAPIAYELSRSLVMTEATFEPTLANGILDEMAQAATDIVRKGTPSDAVLTITRTVEARYVGQGHEIALALPDRPLAASDVAALRQAYQDRYRELFGLTVGEQPIEFLTWIVSASAPPVGTAMERVLTRRTSAPVFRAVFDSETGTRASWPVYERDSVPCGSWLSGPALISEPQTTTLVPNGWRARTGPAGHLELSKSAA